MKKLIAYFVILCVPLYAQYNYSFVTTSNAFDATAFSNSHKIVLQNGEVPWPTHTAHLVYHSSDSVYYTQTTDGGQTWQTPIGLYQGIYPAFDVDIFGLRHLTWQQFDTIHSTYEIYYKCLDDYSPPANISETPNNSTLPDLVIDSMLVAHIVWTEEVDGNNQIYYRTCATGIPGDTFRISDYGSLQATYSYPSISIFEPNNRIYVVWDCFDTASYSPYQIHYRYKETNWSATDFLAAEWRVLRHSSLDFSHGGELLSACWEDSTSGNLEVTFYGGNGGGYPTQERSMYPVMATIGDVWSYLFWQEDSLDYEDIYYHLYYGYGLGWYDYGSLRSLFTIQEPVRFPNCCGAYLVWTQGENPPYSIYCANFDYPVSTQEETTKNKKTSLTITPNPFSSSTHIRYVIEPSTVCRVKIFDASGRLVREFPINQSSASGGNQPFVHITWDGTDDLHKELSDGTYFVILKIDNEVLVNKIVKVEK